MLPALKVKENPKCWVDVVDVDVVSVDHHCNKVCNLDANVHESVRAQEKESNGRIIRLNEYRFGVLLLVIAWTNSSS